MGIVWLNPLIFQVRTLRARELLRLVWNHPMQLGEREDYILDLRPQGLGIFSRHSIPSQFAQMQCGAASSTLVLKSLTYLFSLQSQVAPPSHLLLGLISYPPRHSGLELVTQNIQSLLFPHLERAKGDCLGNTSKETERPGSQSGKVSRASGLKAWCGRGCADTQPLQRSSAAQESPSGYLQDGCGVQQACVILQVSLVLAGL